MVCFLFTDFSFFFFLRKPQFFFIKFIDEDTKELLESTQALSHTHEAVEQPWNTDITPIVLQLDWYALINLSLRSDII